MPTDEMAYALTLFVEAAHQRTITEPLDRVFTLVDHEECALLFDRLCVSLHPGTPEASAQTAQPTSLYSAFRVLCSHYALDPLQATICARVLAFHFLMEQTAGAVVEDWTDPLPETPGLISLHPAVIEAMASVPLTSSVQLSSALFRLVLVELAQSAGVEDA